MNLPAWIENARRVTAPAEVVGALREENGAPWVPVGSGRHLGRGTPPPAPVRALDLSGLDAVVEHAVPDLTATVQAGVRLDVLRSQLASRNQWWPPDPGGGGTVGGLIAADRRGVYAGGFGTVRDYVLGATFVDGRGRIARAGGRVVKNVAGYDLMKLLAGSLGEFGVILEVTLRTVPRPATWGAVTAPESGDPETAARVLQEAPRRWLPVGLFRTHTKDRLELAALFAGPVERVRAQSRMAVEGLGPGAVSVEGDAVEALLERLSRSFAPEGAPAGWGGALPGALCAPELARVLGARTWTADLLRGHIGCDATGITAQEAAALREVLAQGEGHLHLETAATCDGAIAAWGADPGPEADLWRGLKQALDPDGRLVSGRLPGGV